jgi:hypothetical protein
MRPSGEKEAFASPEGVNAIRGTVNLRRSPVSTETTQML